LAINCISICNQGLVRHSLEVVLVIFFQD
jgi:hypothetical protein